jgi:hypothetical protein
VIKYSFIFYAAKTLGLFCLLLPAHVEQSVRIKELQLLVCGESPRANYIKLNADQAVTHRRISGVGTSSASDRVLLVTPKIILARRIV